MNALHGHPRCTRRRGVAYIIALLLLSMFCTIAVGIAGITDLSNQQSHNYARTLNARVAAESGLAYHIRALEGLVVSGATGTAFIEELTEKLGARFNGTANVAGAVVTCNDACDTVYVPEITTDNGSFTAAVALDDSDDSRVWLRVTGVFETVSRTLALAFEIAPGSGSTFDYGFATRGQVVMSGQGEFSSANGSPYEADMYSSFYEPGSDTFRLSGQAHCEGVIRTSDADAGVSISGQASVGGICLGVGEVEFPEPKPELFEALATTVLGGSSIPRGTYTNIRIPAGTNPTFASRSTIEGVIYIESPNNVRFSGQATIRGVIVTEDAREDDSGDNSISFSGQVESHGVETLPDSPEFQAIKALPGVFLLAPGFDISASGQFGTVNGAMAADSFRFTGQAGGVVKGPIIAYDTDTFTYSGQAGLTIDRSGQNTLPNCFGGAAKLTPLPDTYAEIP